LEALGILINLIKECFPRDEGWGWNLPEMHAFAKMPHNMLKFGLANNFSGNIDLCYGLSNLDLMVECDGRILPTGKSPHTLT
jgi:hypothetical protein